MTGQGATVRPAAGVDVLPASIATASFLGSVMDHTVIVEGQELKAEGSPELAMDRGQEGFIVVGREHCHAFEG